LHLGLATLDPIPWLAAWLKFSSAQHSSSRGWWRGRWVPLCWRVNWLVADMACQLCILMSQLHHANVIFIWVSHVGQVVWYSGWVSPSGRRRCVASHEAYVGACGHVQRLIFALFSPVCLSTRWYGQNTILTTFIFEQKSNTTLNHMLWYQLLGIMTGDVLIIAHLRLSTLTQYLIWFGKPPTSTGEVICLYRERTRFTTIEEDDHPLFATLNLTLVSLCSATMAATTCCPWQPTLSYISEIFLCTLTLSACSPNNASIYRQQWQTRGH
jgi:hypothetical protein